MFMCVCVEDLEYTEIQNYYEISKQNARNITLSTIYPRIQSLANNDSHGSKKIAASRSLSLPLNESRGCTTTNR